MQKTEINVAIAEVCGWTKEDAARGFTLSQFPEYLPDYCDDLNAMHEAEKVIRRVWKPSDTDTIISNRMHCYVELLYYEIDATAYQRAEAFLKTLSLWTD